MSREITGRELAERYADMLDEAYGTVKVAEFQYDTSHALAEIDPVAFRIGLADYVSSLIEDGVLIEKDGTYYEAED